MSDGMVAGRELDALVAEKVMGEDVSTWDAHKWGPCAYVNDFYPEGSKYCSHCDRVWYNGSPEPPVPCEARWISTYSTSIAAAWEVVEKLKADGLMVDLLTVGDVKDPSWCVTVEDLVDEDGMWFSTHESEAPLAICLAALKAVEDKP